MKHLYESALTRVYLCTQAKKYLWNESTENSNINLKNNISALVFMILKEKIVRSFFRNKKVEMLHLDSYNSLS